MKKFFVILLVCLLSCTFICAADYQDIKDYSNYQYKGENLQWKVEDNTLYIKGKGDFPDFPYSKFSNSVSLPWKNYTYNTIIVEDGLTSIGTYAFAGSNATKIVLPDSVSLIRANAFAGCKNLIDINLPPYLVSVEDEAFYNCNSLKELKFPKETTNFGHFVFKSSNSNEMEGIYVSEKLNTIYPDSFLPIELLHVYDQEQNETIINNELFKLHNETDEDIVINDKVEIIHEEAIKDLDNIETLTLGKNVKELKDYAITKCGRLSLIKVFNRDIKMTPSSIIYNHKKPPIYIISEDKTVTLEDYIKKEEPKEELNNDPFKYERKYLQIEGTTVVKYIKDNYTSIDIPEGITEIADEAFYNCDDDLREITLPSTLKRIGNSAFRKNYINEINIPDSVEEIGDYAFSETYLGKIEIPYSVKKIGDFAFSSCRYLDHLVLPHSNIKLGRGIIENTSLKTLNGEEKEDFFIHDGHLLDYCKYKDEYIKIPNNVITMDNVEIIEGNPYNEYYKVTIPESVELINNIFRFRSGEGKYFVTINGENNDFFIWKGTLVKYFGEEEEITIPSNVKTIGCYAFDNNHNLKKVTIEDGVKEIQAGAFSNCSNLESISIPESVERIEEYAFQNCESLKSLSVPNSVVHLGSHLCENCKQLQNVVIGDNVEALGDFSFSNCQNLYSVVLGNGLKNIGEKCFFQTYIKEVDIKDNVEQIEKYAFASCPNLQKVTMTDSVITIEEGVFSKCSSLTNITLSQSCTYLGPRAFEWCSYLRKVTLPQSLRTIKEKCFSYCYALTYINNMDNVERIEDESFYGDSSLEDFDFSPSLKYIGTNAFSKCKTLTKVILPEGCEYIGDDSFYGCKNVATLSVPSSITYFGEEAFIECYNLDNLIIGDVSHIIDDMTANFNDSRNPITSASHIQLKEGLTVLTYDLLKNLNIKTITLPSTLEVIDDNAFLGCKNLTSIVLPDNINYIGKQAFRNCCNLLKIVIPKDVKVIDDFAFLGCRKLESVVINENIEKIGINAFRACENLSTFTSPSSFTNYGRDCFKDCDKLNKD